MRVLQMEREPSDERTGVFTSGIVSTAAGWKIALYFTRRQTVTFPVTFRKLPSTYQYEVIYDFAVALIDANGAVLDSAGTSVTQQ